MTHETAKKQGLEPVYPVGHNFSDRIFYDPREGKYYDSYSDFYLYDFDPVMIGRRILKPIEKKAV
jgi:hypothetical protein